MDLPDVIAAANNVASEARSTFGHLTPSQLNWKPSAERWSVAQCFDHLMTVNKGYFPEIDRVLAGQSDISASIINDFVDHQAAVVEKMKATQHLDLEKIVITSPVAAIMTYSLMDAYRIIVIHEQRHFQQAKRVTEEPGFPN